MFCAPKFGSVRLIFTSKIDRFPAAVKAVERWAIRRVVQGPVGNRSRRLSKRLGEGGGQQQFAVHGLSP
ncbi:MAG: hypothetical protein DYH02_16835 [Candidatus Omnitrophica bacterium COP1]|nr:hypothetical protein [Candidatus Omnitrophica bacterium COP1]